MLVSISFVLRLICESFAAIIMEFRGLDNEVYVSQAVSKEERDMIFSGPSLYWSERTNVYWCSHMRHLSRTSVYSAKFLGFKFETENDRVSYEKLLEDPRKFVTITLVKKRAK